MIERNKDAVRAIISDIKRLAQSYRELTGRPLGITGECAECEVEHFLGLELAPVRTAGYDALETVGEVKRKVQIKGRCILDARKSGQRLGSIDLKQEFDAVMLVLLDEKFNALEIIEASRNAIVIALEAPGSKARNERGALSISKFKSIGKVRWRRQV